MAPVVPAVHDESAAGERRREFGVVKQVFAQAVGELDDATG